LGNKTELNFPLFEYGRKIGILYSLQNQFTQKIWSEWIMPPQNGICHKSKAKFWQNTADKVMPKLAHNLENDYRTTSWTANKSWNTNGLPEKSTIRIRFPDRMHNLKQLIKG
jgi:hypothetical protein